MTEWFVDDFGFIWKQIPGASYVLRFEGYEANRLDCRTLAALWTPWPELPVGAEKITPMEAGKAMARFVEVRQ